MLDYEAHIPHAIHMNLHKVDNHNLTLQKKLVCNEIHPLVCISKLFKISMNDLSDGINKKHTKNILDPPQIHQNYKNEHSRLYI